MPFLMSTSDTAAPKHQWYISQGQPAFRNFSALAGLRMYLPDLGCITWLRRAIVGQETTKKAYACALPSLILALTQGAFPACEARVLVLPSGRVIQSSVEPPFSPSTSEDCRQFSHDLEARKTLISKAHDECLEANKDATVSTQGRDPGLCSAPPCQGLHTARTELTEQGRSDLSSCYSEVSSKNQRQEVTVVDAQEEHAIRAISRGPIIAMRRAVRDAMATAIGSAFDVETGTVKRGMNTGFIVKRLLSQTDRLTNACEARNDSKSSEVCRKEVLQSIHDMESHVPFRVRGSPAIAIVQSAMIERLGIEQRESVRQLDEALNQQFQDTPRDRKPAIRPRARGVIENR